MDISSVLTRILDPLTLFSVGLVSGIIPCMIWGSIGGDEGINIPYLKPLLKLIHHWHLGIIIMVIGVFTSPYVLGWGTGTALDDLLFHSFEGYFMRKEEA